MAEIGIKEEVHQLVEESDHKILRAIKAMLEAYHGEKMSSEQISELELDIKTSEKEYRDGAFYTHDEVAKISDQWKHQKM